MHKKLHIWFYEWLAFIVSFYIIVVGMYFIEYMKLNLVLNDYPCLAECVDQNWLSKVVCNTNTNQNKS